MRGAQLAALWSAYVSSMAISDDRGWQYWAGIHGLPLPLSRQHHTSLSTADQAANVLAADQVALHTFD